MKCRDDKRHSLSFSEHREIDYGRLGHAYLCNLSHFSSVAIQCERHDIVRL